MKLPALVDYQQAVQNPRSAFMDGTLRQGSPRLTPLGLPAVASGGFALTFDVTVGRDRFAVRCFHKEGNHLQERYQRIADFVRKNSRFGFLVDVEYIPSGIRVADQSYPVVRMPWVEGIPLSDWVDDHLNEPDSLGRVRSRISAAANQLHQAGTAHGDLQHGNILVSANHIIRLVDYDGMFLPALRDLGASEQGHRNYQHPGRADHFNKAIDCFAAFVIDLSLQALQHEPGLWNDFHTGENLLFTAADFVSPEKSGVFAELTRLSALANRVRRLMDACTSDFAVVPDVLFGARAQSTPVRTNRARQPGGAKVPVPVPATKTAELRARHGDEVTIFGRVRGTKVHDGYRQPIVNINFGHFKRGDFTIVAFNKASDELIRKYGEGVPLNGSWVALTGLVTLYQSRHCADPTPQIELTRVRSLRLLEQHQVEEFQAAARGEQPHDHDQPEETRVPTRKQALPAESKAGEPSRSDPWTRPTEDIEQRLGQLYSTPEFAGPHTGATGAAAPPAASDDTASARPSIPQPAQPSSRPPAPPPPVPEKYRVTRLSPNAPPHRPVQREPARPGTGFQPPPPAASPNWRGFRELLRRLFGRS